MTDHFPPPGTCVCHTHTVGPFDKFPLQANRPYTPHEATFEDLAAMMKRLGTSRVVIVQPSIYGTDNGCTMDSVDRLNGNGRAVIVVVSRCAGIRTGGAAQARRARASRERGERGRTQP